MTRSVALPDMLPNLKKLSLTCYDCYLWIEDRDDDFDSRAGVQWLRRNRGLENLNFVRMGDGDDEARELDLDAIPDSFPYKIGRAKLREARKAILQEVQKLV